MIESKRSPVVYIDANTFIYLIEGTDAVARPIRELLMFLGKAPGLAVTSELSLAEVLLKVVEPTRRKSYLDLIIWNGVVDPYPVSRDILIETAEYRRAASGKLPDGRPSFPRLPDAIHVVTAVRNGCSKFLSADARIKLPSGLTRVAPDMDGVATLLKELS